MHRVQILCILLAHANSALSFSHEQVQLASNNILQTNCTFREIIANVKCGGTYGSELPPTEADSNQYSGLTHTQIWTYSIGSAFFISLSGLWGYVLLPLLNGAYQDHVMNVLVGLSCGSLITSSLCQLIPEIGIRELQTSLSEKEVIQRWFCFNYRAIIGRIAILMRRRASASSGVRSSVCPVCSVCLLCLFVAFVATVDGALAKLKYQCPEIGDNIATFEIQAYELWLLSPNYLNISVFSMAGVWFVLIVQNFSVILRKDTTENKPNTENSKRVSSKNSEAHLKSRNGGPSLPLSEVEAAHPLFSPNQGDPLKSKLNLSINSPCTETELKVPPTLISQRRCSFQSLNIQPKAKLGKLAIIILAGDFMNNFMDGISIGCGYAYLLSTGLKLTTAISFEEYTHKLGDFAIVFQSGISMKRVLFWNYITSCACFLGVAIGIALGTLQWSKYIFSFASGLFLFIALSNMIPEMQNMLEHSLNKSKRDAIIALIEQHVGFLLAFVALLIISLLINGDPKKH